MITWNIDEVETQLVPSIPTVGTRLIGRYGKGSLDSTRLERFFVNSENVTLQLWINAEIVLCIIQLLPYLDTLKISKFTWTPFLTTNTPFSFAPNIYPQLYNSFFQHATLATIILESMDVTTVRPDVFHLASFTSQMVSFEAYKCYWHIISNVLPSPIPLRLKSLVLSSCSATTSFFYPNILLPSVTNLEKLHVNNLRWGDGSEDVTWFSDMLKSSSTSLKELKYTICSKQSMLLFYSV